MYYWLPVEMLKTVSESDVEVDGIKASQAVPPGLNVDAFQQAKEKGMLALINFTGRRSALSTLHSVFGRVSSLPHASIVSDAFSKLLLPSNSAHTAHTDELRPQNVAVVLSSINLQSVTQLIDWALKTPAVRTLSLHFRNGEIDDQFAAASILPFTDKLPLVTATCHLKTQLRVTFTSEQTPGVSAFHHFDDLLYSTDLVIALDGYVPEDVRRTAKTKVYVPEELRSLFGYVSPQLKHWTSAMALALPSC